MKAIICTKYGSPDDLKLKKIDKPTPKDNEVLIKIHAATVNRTDCAALSGKPFIVRFFTGLFKPKHQILGTEFAGKIEAIGEKVKSFKVGDKVFGFDDAAPGSHAQYKTISENKALAIMPKKLTYHQAAASTEGSFYANNFINKVKFKKRDKFLVNGASGGIGSAVLQLLKYYGANVTAVCNTKNIKLIKSLGADRIIDYTKEDFTKDDQKYSFIFDTVGKSSFGKCKALLKSGGIYISSELGFMAQNIFLALFTPIFRKKKVIFPMPKDCRGSVILIKKLIEKGKYKAVIDKKYPLEQIVEAYKYVETGQKTGNVVITVD